MADTDQNTKDTLYYDGNCPLCTAEVCKLQQYNKGGLHVQDIHSMPIHHMPGEAGQPDKQALLQRLHLRTSVGEWLIGVEANVQAWQHTRFAALWRVLTWPVVRYFSAVAYEIWLRWRGFRKGRSAG